MAKEKTLIEKGDKLRYNGLTSDRLTNGAIYEVTGLSDAGSGMYVDNLGTTRYLISGIAKHFELVEETAESGGDSMGCANTKLKKGDFVRYLGGDPGYYGNLTDGKVYEVMGVDNDAYIYDNYRNEWYVCEDTENTECFVKVFDELSDEPVISDYEKKAQDFGESDAVHQPAHYTQGKFETIEIIEEITQGYSDGFVAHCAGTAIKYIARAPFKHDSPLEDIRKARAYLDFAIERIEGSGE